MSITGKKKNRIKKDWVGAGFFESEMWETNRIPKLWLLMTVSESLRKNARLYSKKDI